VGCVQSNDIVAVGEAVSFSASGNASYGYEGSPINNNPTTNPNGHRFVNGFNILPKIDISALVPEPIGALVGKIGSQGQYFFIGSSGQMYAPTSGVLSFCYNDSYFGDDSGSYTVNVKGGTILRQAPVDYTP